MFFFLCVCFYSKGLNCLGDRSEGDSDMMMKSLRIKIDFLTFTR